MSGQNGFEAQRLHAAQEEDIGPPVKDDLGHDLGVGERGVVAQELMLRHQHLVGAVRDGGGRQVADTVT